MQLDDRILKVIFKLDLKILNKNRNFQFSGGKDHNLHDISITIGQFCCISCAEHEYKVYLDEKRQEKSPDRFSQSRFERNFINFLE